jgi:hypothetical protein
MKQTFSSCERTDHWVPPVCVELCVCGMITNMDILSQIIEFRASALGITSPVSDPQRKSEWYAPWLGAHTHDV